jgi:hypothetical protein
MNITIIMQESLSDITIIADKGIITGGDLCEAIRWL